MNFCIDEDGWIVNASIMTETFSHRFCSRDKAALDFCQNIQLYPCTWSKFIQMDPPVDFQSWRFLAFPLYFSVAAELQIASSRQLPVLFFPKLFPEQLFYHLLAGVPWWTFKIPLYKSSVNFFFSLQTYVAHPFDTHSIFGFLYKEVTSSVCTSVAILTTVSRLFVKRLVLWFDDVSRFPCSRPI